MYNVRVHLPTSAQAQSSPPVFVSVPEAMYMQMCLFCNLSFYFIWIQSSYTTGDTSNIFLLAGLQAGLCHTVEVYS